MVATDITLQHSDVNGGTAVELNGASVKYGWKNETKSYVPKGKFDIAEVDYNGFESPIITVTGNIDVDDSTANRITQSLLMDFAQCNTGSSNLKLTVTAAGEGGTGTYLKGRPAAGYSVGGTYLDYVNVQIESFNIDFATGESKEGKVWRYTMVMRETEGV